MSRKKGSIPWNKGLTKDDPRVEKYASKIRGVPKSEEHIKKMKANHSNMSGENNPNFGKKSSQETLDKMSKKLEGKIPWNKGIPRTQNEKDNISNATKGKMKGVPKSEEHKRKIGLPQIGSGNHNWNGGTTCLPYCEKFNEKLREQIRERDNRICQKCNKTELENGRKLSVHHIHYDKENCYPDLITLCGSCNTKVNINRTYWEEYFMEKLKERNLINYFDKEK